MNSLNSYQELDFLEPKTTQKLPLNLQPSPEVADEEKERQKVFNVIQISSDALGTSEDSAINVVRINDTMVAIVPFFDAKPVVTESSSKIKKAAWEKEKMDLWRYLIAGGLAASLLAHSLIQYASGGYNIGSLLVPPANAQTTIRNIPTTFATNRAPAPDWSKINFGSMKFSDSGSVQFPNIKNPGMKQQRTWSAGQSLSEVMELGDFEGTGFKIEDLNLAQISKITGTSLGNIKLSNFELLNWQTLADLNAVVPGLSKLSIASVPPLADFLNKVLPGRYNGNQTIGQVVKNHPQLNNIELGKYINLDRYNLNSIPGLKNASIKGFTNWQNNTISQVPGLSGVPFDQFPGVPVPDMSFVGKVDIVLKQIENGRWKSISGSYQEGFNVPCYNKQCAHIEVAGSPTLTGAAWMSGKYQQVKGGFGILGDLNGGKEPTGRHPFGSSFKQVLWEPNEAKGTITSSMYFRICKRGFIDLGCSPYFIGPVPFFEYKEMDPIILGAPLTVPKQPGH